MTAPFSSAPAHLPCLITAVGIVLVLLLAWWMDREQLARQVRLGVQGEALGRKFSVNATARRNRGGLGRKLAAAVVPLIWWSRKRSQGERRVPILPPTAGRTIR